MIAKPNSEVSTPTPNNGAGLGRGGDFANFTRDANKKIREDNGQPKLSKRKMEERER